VTVDLALALLSGYSPALHEVLFILLTLIIYIPAFSEKRGKRISKFSVFLFFLFFRRNSKVLGCGVWQPWVLSKYHQEYWGMCGYAYPEGWQEAWKAAQAAEAVREETAEAAAEAARAELAALAGAVPAAETPLGGGTSSAPEACAVVQGVRAPAAVACAAPTQRAGTDDDGSSSEEDE
jgi:hypothetical protein